MKRMIITITMALLLPALLVAAREQTLKMKIEGMTCGMCETKVKKQLSSFCDPISIDHKKGSALCTLKEGAKDGQVVEECNKTGFKCTKG